ncbi:MAG: alpha/beta fold hydrolase [Pseudomonadota bacterium]
MAKIVLAHGFLGFGAVHHDQRFNYFNEIEKLYRDKHGHDVFCPSVPPLGSLDKRSKELEEKIRARWLGSTDEIYLVAHSMGGLDCRRVLARNPDIAKRVKRLITISAPHYGTPLADMAQLPGVARALLPSSWLTQAIDDNAGAVGDLATREEKQDTEVDGVDYLCIGCRNTRSILGSHFFSVASLAGRFGATENDGVVSLRSASRTGREADLLEIWPVDHGEALGWPSGHFGFEAVEAAHRAPPEHIARYERVLAQLLK